MKRLFMAAVALVLTGCTQRQAMDQQWIFAKTPLPACQVLTVKNVDLSVLTEPEAVLAAAVANDAVSSLRVRRVCKEVVRGGNTAAGLTLSLALLSVGAGGRQVAVSGVLADSGNELARFRHTSVDLLDPYGATAKLGENIAEFIGGLQ